MKVLRCRGGSPATYNLANEQITTVLPHFSGSGTSTIFLLLYGSVCRNIFAAFTASQREPGHVRQHDLAVQLQEIIGATTTSVISTGAAIRNLKTNLGN